MAIKKLIDREKTPQRAEYPSAYHKVVEIDAGGPKVVVRIDTYADEGARRYNENNPHPMQPQPLFSNRITIEPSALTFTNLADLKSAIYTYLKTLPEFSGAIDC